VRFFGNFNVFVNKDETIIGGYIGVVTVNDIDIVQNMTYQVPVPVFVFYDFGGTGGIIEDFPGSWVVLFETVQNEKISFSLGRFI
jgi:hypothetical protein